MTNPMFNPQPNYSGVTIQIANPAVYAGTNCNTIPANNRVHNNQTINPAIDRLCYPAQYYIANPDYCTKLNEPNTAARGYNLTPAQAYGITLPERNEVYHANNYATNHVPANGFFPPESVQTTTEPKQFAYPPQYYLNNYNYVGTPVKDEVEEKSANMKVNRESDMDTTKDTEIYKTPTIDAINNEYNAIDSDIPENDMTKSSNIIDDINQRAAKAEEAKKNQQKKNIVPLTDEYIKSLENYLNNPNNEIRLMASKEILTRLDEDKDRYDDAALNALLNKMLQDPSKLIRVAALSAFASQLASGNDYTVTLLHNIQQNPSADKEDVLQAADILLKMSAEKEIKEIPDPTVKETK